MEVTHRDLDQDASTPPSLLHLHVPKLSNRLLKVLEEQKQPARFSSCILKEESERGRGAYHLLLANPDEPRARGRGSLERDALSRFNQEHAMGFGALDPQGSSENSDTLGLLECVRGLLWKLRESKGSLHRQSLPRRRTRDANRPHTKPTPKRLPPSCAVRPSERPSRA